MVTRFSQLQLESWLSASPQLWWWYSYDGSLGMSTGQIPWHFCWKPHGETVVVVFTLGILRGKLSIPSKSYHSRLEFNFCVSGTSCSYGICWQFPRQFYATTSSQTRPNAARICQEADGHWPFNSFLYKKLSWPLHSTKPHPRRVRADGKASRKV